MGILNLTELLKKNAPEAIHQRTLDTFKGRKIGIDVSIFLYKYVRNGQCMEGMIKLILRLLKNGILPVFIFDGKPPKEKSDVIEERKEKREILEIKKEVMEKIVKEKDTKTTEELSNEIKELMTTKNDNVRLNDEEIANILGKENIEEELEKTKRNIIYIRSEHVELTKNICNLMGVPFIVSNGEAETLLANLCRDNVLDAIISEDTDVLVGGGKIFLRDFQNDNNKVTEYCLQGILDGFGVTYDQFIDISILCRCDYTTKISNMGPKTALKMIKDKLTLENVLVELSKKPEKYTIPENFDFNQARFLFKNALINENISELIQRIKIVNPNIEELNNLIVNSNSNLHEKYKEEIQNNLIEYLKIIKNHLPDNCREFVYQQQAKETKDTKNMKKITSFFTTLPKDSKK